MSSARPDPQATINKPVFFTTLSLVVGFVLFTALFVDTAQAAFQASLDIISERFGWFYVLSVGALLLFSIWLAFGPYSHIRLGPDDSKPEFSTKAWFAMLFSAGMGIGLLFFSVAEPIMHYAEPPTGPGETPKAALRALSITFFHWGAHAWAIYATLGATLAYFAFRKKLPLSVRSAFYPLIGEKIHGPIGHTIDVIAVWGTIFGLATSLGFGAMQVNAGLHHVFGIEESTTVQVLLIAGITVAATVSLVTGLKKGIRILSESNVMLGASLLVFVFFAGPTLFELEIFSDALGMYLGNIVRRTFWTDSVGDGDWLKSWTFFYWGWWIAWAPFVGMFIARVSRGRTLREFVLGVLCAPTLVTFVWMSVFGGAALHAEMHGADISAAVQENVATSIYALLEGLPLSSLTSLVAIVVTTLFFVTSSDSGSMVVDMITSGGHPNPPTWQRIFWASTEGVVAAVLLIGGGLKALQAAALGTGLPFSIVLLLSAVGLVKALRKEPKKGEVPKPTVN